MLRRRDLFFPAFGVKLRQMMLGVLFLVALFWIYQRWFLAEAGQRALNRLPDAIAFRRLPADAWGDPVTAEWLAKPLREKGFVDLGVYEVLPVGGFKLGVMLNEKDGVAAFLCERPKTPGLSLELNVRYLDGTTTMLINRADNGVPKPPFFRVLFDPLGASSGELYDRLLRERSPVGIKPITAASVFTEYQSAWTMMMRWEKGRGLTPEEVFTIAAIAREGAANPTTSDAWSSEFPSDADNVRNKFLVERDGGSLRITFRLGTTPAAAFLFVVALGWFQLNRFLFNLGRHVHEAGVDLASFLWALVPAAGYGYYGLALLLNRWVVRADGARLTVRSGPIPWPGARDIRLVDIGRIYSEAYVSYEGRGGGGARYRVMVMLKNGKTIQLLPGGSDPAKAEFIVQRLASSVQSI